MTVSRIGNSISSIARPCGAAGNTPDVLMRRSSSRLNRPFWLFSIKVTPINSPVRASRIATLADPRFRNPLVNRTRVPRTFCPQDLTCSISTTSAGDVTFPSVAIGGGLASPVRVEAVRRAGLLCVLVGMLGLISALALLAGAVFTATSFVDILFLFSLLSFVSVILGESCIGLFSERRGAGAGSVAGAFAISMTGAGGIIGAIGRLFGKYRGIAIGSGSVLVLAAGIAGALRVMWVLLAVTGGVAVVGAGDGGFGLSRRGDVTGAGGVCGCGAKTTAMG